MIRLVAAAALALAATACVADGVPEVASARLSYAGGSEAAIYFVAEGGPDRLTGVTVDGMAGQIHESIADADGRMRMQPLAAPPEVAPSSPLVFEPGGRHIMVVGLEPGVWTPGDRVEVVVVWEQAGEQRLLVPVVDPATALEGIDD